MRSGNGGGIIAVVLLFGMFLIIGAAACAISGRGVAIHSIDTYATREARPPSVGERAEAIRAQTRLDNRQGIPTGFWVITLALVVFVGGGALYLTLGPKLHEAIANRKKQERLANKQQRPAPSPYTIIEPPWGQMPQPPRQPRLPGPPS